MRVILTGCCGFVGWKTGEKLLESGCDVLGIDEMNDYYDVRLKEWRLEQLVPHKKFHFEKRDIASSDIMGLIEKFNPDLIINLAARAGVRASIENPGIYFRTNLSGTLNLLEIAKELGIRKFVLASTSSLYAGEEMPFSEDLPVNRPISPYAASKKAAEAACYTYHYLYDIDVCIFRYFTVYGPAGRPDMSIFRFVKLINEEQDIIVYGDGTQSRDFTYVEDIAEGTVRGYRLNGFNVINLGGNRPYKLNELISQIEKMTGKKARIIYKDFQKTDVTATWADISKAEKLIGWKPQVSFVQGIKKTVDWYMENRQWLSNVSVSD